MMIPKTCSHGKTLDERCIGCEIVTAKEGERWALESLAKYRSQIEHLEALAQALRTIHATDAVG